MGAVTMDRTSDLGLDEGAVEALLTRAKEEIRDDLLPSCQLALAREGRLALFVALGDATTDNRYVLYSVTKALTAGAIWALMSDGSLDPSMRVAELVPEFATNGKEAVTVEHLLTHTAGFPRAPMHPLEGGDRAERLRRFASWRLDWEPGTQFEYHPSSAHWVLGEVIERVTSASYKDCVKNRLTTPLGLRDFKLGETKDRQENILDVTVVGNPPDGEVLRDLGIKDSDLMLSELGDKQLLRYNEPAVRVVGSPGAGAVATAGDVALYFQALLHDPAGLWNPAVLADGTGNIRVRLPDPYTSVPANRTLGLVLAGDDGKSAFRGFGFDAGPRTFGSPGTGGQVAWADPDSGLSFAYLTNGLDADVVRSARRSISVSTLAAACAPVEPPRPGGPPRPDPPKRTRSR
jgi:CubicO group peptidase (beta-lactamase class C family)